MKFILPTQWPPLHGLPIGSITLEPYKRIKLPIGLGELHLDSMSIECLTNDWIDINEWLTFHALIFDDVNGLDYYESSSFNPGRSLDTVGDCAYLVDYKDISGHVLWTREYESCLAYTDLYDQYTRKTKKDGDLIRSYLSSGNQNTYTSFERTIRDTSFWRLTALFSIVEVIIGKPARCASSPPCKNCTKKRDHKIAKEDWFFRRLNELIKNPQRAQDYLSVIWLVREKIRHPTVHESAISNARYEAQSERMVTYDMPKISAEWRDAYSAQLALEQRMREVTRLLLLNQVFKISFFPELTTLKTTRIG